MVSTSDIVFGLQDYPRPRGWGYFYCKLPPKNEEICLAELMLNDHDECQLAETFSTAIRTLVHERLDDSRKVALLRTYETENMRPWAEEVLRNVLQQLVPDIVSAHIGQSKSETA